HMKSWMVPVTPLTSRQEIRLAVPAATSPEVRLYLAAGTAGDGAAHDLVVWQQPRFVIPDRPDLPLRDVRDFTLAMSAWRDRLFASTARCLAAAAEASNQTGKLDVPVLARRHGVEAEALVAWLDYLGIGAVEPKLDLFTRKLPR